MNYAYWGCRRYGNVVSVVFRLRRIHHRRWRNIWDRYLSLLGFQVDPAGQADQVHHLLLVDRLGRVGLLVLLGQELHRCPVVLEVLVVPAGRPLLKIANSELGAQKMVESQRNRQHISPFHN